MVGRLGRRVPNDVSFSHYHVSLPDYGGGRYIWMKLVVSFFTVTESFVVLFFMTVLRTRFLPSSLYGSKVSNHASFTFFLIVKDFPKIPVLKILKGETIRLFVSQWIVHNRNVRLSRCYEGL